jgi:endoglucanase
MTDSSSLLLGIGEAQLELLQQLCQAAGISGYENEVRAIVLEQARPLADEIHVDALGNVLAVRHGLESGAARLRVMVAAHMDEVGLMLTDDEGDGIFRFESIGANPRYLVGKAVRVGRDHLPGVIGTEPVHFQNGDNHDFPGVDALRIDMGAGAAGRVRAGDYVVFSTPFTRMGDGLRAKALDDRLGVAGLIELLRHAPPNIDLLAAFTVQEEIGARGAGAAAYSLNPDLAIALDCTPAIDLPDSSGRYNTHSGQGPAIYTVDSSTVSDPRLVRWLVESAEAHGLPYQMRQPGGGGTDAGAIHKTRAGIPSVSLSTPGRYLHTPACYARLDDWENTLRLAHAALSRLNAEIMAGER